MARDQESPAVGEYNQFHGATVDVQGDSSCCLLGTHTATKRGGNKTERRVTYSIFLFAFVFIFICVMRRVRLEF